MRIALTLLLALIATGLPLSSAAATETEGPSVPIPAGILVASDGTVLWQRRAEQSRPMASTTKVMTAMLVLETTRRNEVVRVSPKAAETAWSSIALAPGTRYRAIELVEAMLVYSANNAAAALAEHVAGSTAGFAAMMNDRAKDLGLTKTHFQNPHGLHQAHHYSSAADLATLTSYAMLNPTFRRIVGSEKTAITRMDGTRVVVENTNPLLAEFPGANGVKTGFTTPAGYTLIAGAKRDGVQLYAVVLGAKSMRARADVAATLLRWGFRHPHKSGAAAPRVAGPHTAATPPAPSATNQTKGDAMPTDSAGLPPIRPSPPRGSEKPSSEERMSDAETPDPNQQDAGTPDQDVQDAETLAADARDAEATSAEPGDDTARSDNGDPGTWEQTTDWIARAWHTVTGWFGG